jgi:hypothetical protein
MVLGIHFGRASDLVVPDHPMTRPVRPGLARTATSSTNGATALSLRRPVPMVGRQPDLPADPPTFLLGSRYGKTDRLFEIGIKSFASALMDRSNATPAARSNASLEGGLRRMHRLVDAVP